MDTWLHILVDLSILSFFGVLYYFYQKRRIIRTSYEDIIENLDKFRYELNEYTEHMSKQDSYTQIQNFNNKFEDLYEKMDIESFSTLESESTILNKELREFYKLICDQITDHQSAK